MNCMSVLRLASATIVAILGTSPEELHAGEADGLRSPLSIKERLAVEQASCAGAPEIAIKIDKSGDRAVAQATLCCCTSFDGRSCCNYVERCETPPIVPGCYCQ